jgi:tRNA pseudouridine55 synthase
MARRGKGRRRKGRPVNGILILDKPTGVTSNGALQTVRNIYFAAKAGHTGSLDPLASGMLPICFGQATKVSAYLLDADKSYRVVARLGARTDTGDADGQVVEQSPITDDAHEKLLQVMPQFRGAISQVPPMYSALKQNGQRLYELARKGIDVPREARGVTIHELSMEAPQDGMPVFQVRCSKGTYIRTLVEDMAAAAGLLAHVAVLRRLSVHPFEGQGMVTMDMLETAQAQDPSGLDSLLLPIDSALSDYPSLALGKTEADHVRHGNPVACRREAGDGLIRLYDDKACFVGLGEILEDGRVAPRRLFAEAGPVPG